MKYEELEYDFEKLRKKIEARELFSYMITRTPGKIRKYQETSEATPEQLLCIARSYRINVEKYRIKK